LVPLLKGLKTEDPETGSAISQLLAWNFSMDASSKAAAIYLLWERSLKERVFQLSVSEAAREFVARKSTLKLIDWLTTPDSRFGRHPIEGRDTLLLESLKQAVVELQERFGPNMDTWRLGDRKLHYAWTHHPLSDAVNADLRRRLDTIPVPRPGNGSTVTMTTDQDNQTSGGTFRIIADLADWDRSLGSNSPGQSGNPENEHYQDLLEPWSQGRYFPLYYSRGKIDSVARSRTILEPADR
ncbi:MAG: penicillin acylase family protein, partial [bacterium]